MESETVKFGAQEPERFLAGLYFVIVWFHGPDAAIKWASELRPTEQKAMSDVLTKLPEDSGIQAFLAELHFSLKVVGVTGGHIADPLVFDFIDAFYEGLRPKTEMPRGPKKPGPYHIRKFGNEDGWRIFDEGVARTPEDEFFIISYN